MARPRTGRRLHTEAFDDLLRARGTTCAAIARKGLSASHLSDLRSGRRSVTPLVAEMLAQALGLETPDVILCPVGGEA